MTGEFRQYLFRTADQWRHGVGFRLQTLPTGGFQLFSAPAFERWVTRVDQARSVTSLDVNECGRVLWLQRATGDLYRIDPSNERVERLIPLAREGPTPPAFGRMMEVNGRIWIHDRARQRLLALRGDTFQILVDLDIPIGIDAAMGRGRVHVLDTASVRSFDSETGRPLGAFSVAPATAPVAVGVDRRDGAISVIDACRRGFLRFTADGRFNGELGRFDEISPTFVPRFLCLDPSGNHFVSDGGARVHQFSADGGYVGNTGALGPIAAVSALTHGADGHLYVADPGGIARLALRGGTVGHAGLFYSGTLDNGSRDHEWHRVDLVADVADDGAIDLYYATSDEAALAGHVSKILAEPAGASDKVAAIEKALNWRGPHQLRAIDDATTNGTAASAALVREPTHSVLFEQNLGRYLWLKIVLSGLTPRATAAIHELRVNYPRLSYLRYLPAVYQEDEPSREFLERYLSIFETVMSGLEATIGRTSELFDPRRTPPEFLQWLAQWLDIAVEEDWPDTVKRQLIGNASGLYARKGTPAGLADFIQIVTGKRPLIRESFDTDRPSVLGGSLALDGAARLTAAPVEDRPPQQYTPLGARTLGTSQIRSDQTTPANAFAAAAHRFTVVVSLSPQQYSRHARGLHRVIREQSPAHAAYDLRVAHETGLGVDAVVGVSWRVVDPQPLHLGYSTLGRSICHRKVSYGPELGVDATLVEGAGRRASGAALCSGE